MDLAESLDHVPPAAKWPDWSMQLGARFLGHPMAPQFQAARVVIDDPNDAIVRDLGNWTMTEEWYSFRSSPG
jgi:uncharacterized protein